MEKDKNITKWILPSQGKTLYNVQLPSKKRKWMDVNNGHAYKCLPLVVANGFGWEIINPIEFEATWNGSEPPQNSILFKFSSSTAEEKTFIDSNQISSHFGNGIITFSSLNFIIKTTKNHNIFLKGPTNHFKHGAHALEAIMESDWLPYTFTLNWKITKPNVLIKFEKGEPLACLFPFPRNYLESFEAIEVVGDKNSEFNKEHELWANKRKELNGGNNLFYSKGIEESENKKVFETHQKSIVGCPFKRENEND